MLSDQLGIRLILWMGPTIPVPAPIPVLDALRSIEVTNDDDQGDGFQMTFAMDKGMIGEFDLLASGSLMPSTRVIIGVVFGVMPEVLIDGIITHQQVNPGGGTQAPTLTVSGKDVSSALNFVENNASYPNQPDSVIVLQLIARYAQFGLVPTVTPTTNVPIEIQRTPRQYETDLAFINRMAARNGYVFYVEPITFGVNKAYWGPKMRTGALQPALTMNMGAASNVEQLSFSHNALAPIAVSGSFVEPISGMTIPIPYLPPLKVPPLVPLPTMPLRQKIMRETGKQDAATAVTTALAAAANSPDSVQGSGRLKSVRYGTALRARKLVGVRGAGLSYDGFYYVKRVSHSISRTDYTQSFSISREGTGPLSPVVPT